MDAFHKLLGSHTFLDLLLDHDYLSSLTYSEIKQLMKEITRSQMIPDILVKIVQDTPQLTLAQRLKIFDKYIFKAINEGHLLNLNRQTLYKWNIYKELLQHWSNRKKEKLLKLAKDKMNKTDMTTLYNILFEQENEE